MGTGSSQSTRAEVRGHSGTYAEFKGDARCHEGKFRLAYEGTFHGAARIDGKQCVVKVYKKKYYAKQDEFAWRAEKLAYEKALEMAEQFNKKYGTSKPIEFVKPEFADINTNAASKLLGYNPYQSCKNIPRTVTVTVETYLEGAFEKFISNFGYVSDKQMATPAAFSHFTYDASVGEILVCDLQGLRTNTSYQLTDPAVHSSGLEPQKYGRSDLGKLGIVQFFMHHTCNVLCEGLKKPKGALNCTTGERVTFDKIAGKMPEGCVADTYQLADSSTGALLGLILSTPVESSTKDPDQLGIDRSRFEQFQRDIKLE